MRKVAVVGVLGSGKSTVCHMFSELGAYCISADEIAHQLLTPHTQVGQKVIDLLGEEIVVAGQIDRHLVAERVFKDRALLEAVEKIIHPEVLKEVKKVYKEVSRKAFPLYVVEVPLLFESGYESFFDTIIAVTSPQTRKSEIPMSEERKKRMLPDHVLREKADIVLENQVGLAELKEEVKKIFTQLT